MSIKAINGNIVLKLVEQETKTSGGIVLTQSTTAPKNQAEIISGGDESTMAGDANAVFDGDIVIFNTREKLEEVDGKIIVPRSAILAVLN